MELRPHQVKAVKESPNIWGLWFRMRVGKTPTAIRLATSRVDSALVICPKQLSEQWAREIKTWNDRDDFKFHIISRDQFRRDWNKLPYCQAIIVDECHRAFGNYKSKLFKAGESYLKKHGIKHLWLLTGTPFTSQSWSIFSYGKLMGKNWDWYQWKSAFFYDVKMGRRMIPLPKKGMDGKLQEILKKIGTVVDLKDVAEIPDDDNILEYFDLNADQKRCIAGLNDTTPIVQYIHTHELESGVLKSDGYGEELQIKCNKDARLLELVEENDKIVIVARYLAQLDKYEKLLSDCNKKIFIIKGGTKIPASEVALEAEKHHKAIVLVQSDTCEGYSLKSFNVMVFTSLSYSFVNYDQSKFRIKAAEKNIPCTYIHFLTRDKTVKSMGKSMDQAVYDSVSNKQDFSFGLFGH